MTQRIVERPKCPPILNNLPILCRAYQAVEKSRREIIRILKNALGDETQDNDPTVCFKKGTLQADKISKPIEVHSGKDRRKQVKVRNGCFDYYEYPQRAE